MLEILNNEEFNDPNIEFPKKQMKKSTKRLLIFGFAFAIAIYAILSSVARMAEIYSDSFKNVRTYIGYLNESYEVSDIVKNPIETADFNNFRDKAILAGFGVFRDGVVDLSQEEIALNSNLTLTGRELGAFINSSMLAEGVELFELMELTIFKEKPEPIITEDEEGNQIIIENPIDTSIVKMRSVFKINFMGVNELIKEIIPNIAQFPQEIYVTTEYDVVVGLDGKSVESKNGKQFINALEGEKNEKVLQLLVYVFGGFKDDGSGNWHDFSEMSANEFLGVFVSMATDTIEVVTDRTGGKFELVFVGDDVRIRFLPNEQAEQ